MTHISDLTTDWWQNLGFKWKKSRSCYSLGCVHFFPSNKMLVVDAGGYDCVELWPDTPSDIVSVLRMLKGSDE